MSFCLSDLFARERRLAWWILCCGVPLSEFHEHTSALSLACAAWSGLYRNTAPPTKMSSKTSQCSNVGKRLSGVLFIMSKSLFLVKLIITMLLKIRDGSIPLFRNRYQTDTLEKSWVHNHFIKSKISEKKWLGNKEKWISVRLNLVKKKNIYIYCSLCCCKIHSWKTSNIFI